MKLVGVKLQNFRSYRDEILIGIDDMTIIIGKNDAGKSTVLEALDIFFNASAPEKDDACVSGDLRNVRISCIFDNLPVSLVLDELHPTTLGDEYLLRRDGLVEISRIFDCSGSKPKETKITCLANHPTSADFNDLHSLKIAALKARAIKVAADLTAVNQTIKSQLRKAIWAASPDLIQQETEVDLSSEGKEIWDQIKKHLPVYALFKSDRPSTDQDEEAQDPMKAAIKEVIKHHEGALGEIVERIKDELNTVAKRTVEKIQEMSPELASVLDPQVKNKNWDSLFSVSLTGEDGIPINKRGSGTRRLVLLNFFRAKAEESADDKSTGVIYAVEEPETSQHPNHQRMLLEAFQEISTSGRAQILLTTHTPTLARKAPRESLRFVSRTPEGRPVVMEGSQDATLDEIKQTLGILPDHDVKVFVGVEGKWDIQFLTRISKILNAADPTVPDLASHESSGNLVFVPLGGSSMELWTNRLAQLDRPEIYITDRDNPPPQQPKYHAMITFWNGRPNCSGHCTTKRELENYLHIAAIRSVYPVLTATTIADFDDVPMLVAEAVHVADPAAHPWANVTPENQKKKASRVKAKLNTECTDAMTTTMLQQSDTSGDIERFLRLIGTHLN